MAASMMSVWKGVRKGKRKADTDADAVGIESAGESLQLAYELHAQPRGLLINGTEAPWCLGGIVPHDRMGGKNISKHASQTFPIPRTCYIACVSRS